MSKLLRIWWIVKLLLLGTTFVVALQSSWPSCDLLPGKSRQSTKLQSTLRNGCPLISPVSGLENRFYSWRHGQQIRYQCTDTVGGPPVLLIHGLFVNCDHWRKTMTALRDAGYNAYAMDLFGCGYSDKPPANSDTAQLCNGENKRFVSAYNVDNQVSPVPLKDRVVPNVALGTADGRDTRTVDVELCHPLGSPYNFYTWADQIIDFCNDVILRENVSKSRSVSLVANSIGTMSAFQAIIDQPDLFTGAFIVCPNFRELHSAEIPLASITMPLVRQVQQTLRERGQPLFDFLAKPDTVKTILKEPYYVTTAVDDALVQVLLDPLLAPGASQVVFDTLSYSAGPLPEQQLQDFPTDRPVWVCYGDRDPWTPGPRVEALKQFAPVTKVIPLAGAGHCPHDEVPELVNPLLLEFLHRVQPSS